jgi:hypothetical protein
MRSLRPIIASLAVAAAAGASLTPAMSASAAGQEDAQQAGQYQVTLKASAKEAVAKEDIVKLTGTVIPKPPEGSKVVVQVKYEGLKSWKKVGSATVKPNGNYRFDVEPESRLDRSYRVVKKTDGKAEGDTSRERAVAVTAWSWLSQLAPSAGANVIKTATMPINGDVYGHVLFSPTSSSTAFTEFTLGRNCTDLDVTFGLSDRTETGGKAFMTLKADGAVAFARAFNLGESDTKVVDVTDVFRIRFDMAQDDTTPDTEPSLGAGRVLCD